MEGRQRGSPLWQAHFQGLVPPAALCLPGSSCLLGCEVGRQGGCFSTRCGWSFSLHSHGECTEQLQTHKQILLQQAVGRELGSGLPGCLWTACRWVAADGGWIPPSKSIPQRSSRVTEHVVEEPPARLLFCPAEEALLGHAALPNSAC